MSARTEEGDDAQVPDAARGDTLSPPTSGSVSAAAANAGHPIACDPASHRESHPALRAPLCVCPGNAGGLGQEGGEGDELDGSRLLVPISDLRVPREGAGDTYVPQSQRPCPARPPRTEPMIARASSPGVAVRRARGRLHFVPSATSERRGTNVWTEIGNRSCWSTGMRDAGEVPQPLTPRTSIPAPSAVGKLGGGCLLSPSLVAWSLSCLRSLAGHCGSSSRIYFLPIFSSHFFLCKLGSAYASVGPTTARLMEKWLVAHSGAGIRESLCASAQRCRLSS
ncbi:hypothetical protein B0H10DRAFT_2228389 [Mycena sp. CBHHK59/15]|nr:hypothetical protein B0H10DRAFT_2228389 [Mycena sp. CBHHK59/15]